MQPANPNDPNKQTPATRPLRILVAEDEPGIQMILSRVLADCGHSVEIAGDGLRALARVLCDINAFDLVITDHQMPGIDGLGLVTRLRAANYPGKVIVLSSAPSPAEQLAYRELSVDRMLAKPIRRELLLQTIEEITREATTKA